ncbi:MAG TPA: 30S ribosome-binding factor RbfA [Candidatus Paceibacterota bacterium]|nr:30S ribosome-binding factor RbfA [Candidatus Paceibacterota bacterium]HRZ34585.1 30S ribosome-binding factor RbfA [Candidatus Paceibacterota bacterium]
MVEHPYRKEKILEIISRAAAEFIEKESNRKSLITVTKVELSTDFQKAIIFVTVFPDQDEEAAVNFLKRNLNEFRDFIKEKTRLQQVPWFDFEIDKGEKKRQRIEEISTEI